MRGKYFNQLFKDPKERENWKCQKPCIFRWINNEWYQKLRWICAMKKFFFLLHGQPTANCIATYNSAIRISGTQILSRRTETLAAPHSFSSQLRPGMSHSCSQRSSNTVIRSLLFDPSHCQNKTWALVIEMKAIITNIVIFWTHNFLKKYNIIISLAGPTRTCHMNNVRVWDFSCC